MKRCILAWIFCALAVGQPALVRGDDKFEILQRMDRKPWHESPDNWGLTALIDDRAPGIRVVCTLRNISKIERMLVIVPVESRYEFLWQGTAPELKDKKNWGRSRGSRMRILRIVKPGQLVNDAFLLEDYFVLIKGRRYALRLKQFLEDDSAPGTTRVGVVSHVVEFVAK